MKAIGDVGRLVRGVVVGRPRHPAARLVGAAVFLGRLVLRHRVEREAAAEAEADHADRADDDAERALRAALVAGFSGLRFGITGSTFVGVALFVRTATSR